MNGDIHDDVDSVSDDDDMPGLEDDKPEDDKQRQLKILADEVRSLDMIDAGADTGFSENHYLGQPFSDIISGRIISEARERLNGIPTHHYKSRGMKENAMKQSGLTPAQSEICQTTRVTPGYKPIEAPKDGRVIVEICSANHVRWQTRQVLTKKQNGKMKARTVYSPESTDGLNVD